MPGGKGSSRSGGGSRRYANSYSRPVPTTPHTTHTKETIIITEGPSRRVPGLFGQMAATAGGVAVGSAVGQVVGDAITGRLRVPPRPESEPVIPSDPCAWEIKQFIQCAQTHDLDLCEGFNEAIRSCKARYGQK